MGENKSIEGTYRCCVNSVNPDCCFAVRTAYFPGVFLSFRVTGACPVTTGFIMRVSVRTTTTTTTPTTPTTTTTTTTTTTATTTTASSTSSTSSNSRFHDPGNSIFRDDSCRHKEKGGTCKGQEGYDANSHGRKDHHYRFSGQELLPSDVPVMLSARWGLWLAPELGMHHRDNDQSDAMDDAIVGQGIMISEVEGFSQRVSHRCFQLHRG